MQRRDTIDNNLQILGLARKAGLLAVGSEDTSAYARAGKVRLVISAHDAGEGALRRARNSAEVSCALHIMAPYTSFELGNVSGRGSPGTVAILDNGLAARFLRGLAQTNPERYNDAAEQLTKNAQAQMERNKQTQSGKRRTAQ